MTIIVIAITAVVVTTHAMISRRLTGVIVSKAGTVAFTTVAAIPCAHAAVPTTVATSISPTVTTSAPVTPGIG